jgi:hypothetical protein
MQIPVDVTHDRALVGQDALGFGDSFGLELAQVRSRLS